MKGLELRCIVGIRSYERRREQPLRVDVSLGLDLSTAGRSGRIADSVDYAIVADQVTALLRFREYRLLEVAAEEATAFLFAAHPALRQVQMRLDKPEALAGRARSAAVEMTRSRGAFGSSEDETSYGARSELLRSPEGIVERVRIEPGQAVTFADEHNRLESIVLGPQKGKLIVAARGEATVYRADDAPLLLCRCLAVPEPHSGLDDLSG